jgi:hypothetical protein
MANDMKQLISLIENQNKNLERLIKENERLRSTPFDMTNIERIKMLSEEVAELAKRFDDSFKEAHKHFSNLFKDKKNLYKDTTQAMVEFEKETDQYNTTIKNLKSQLTALTKRKDSLINQYGHDLTKWGAAEKKIYDDLIDDIGKLNDEISTTNKLHNERKKVLDDLREKSLEYYRTANKEQEELNKRFVEGTHAMDDFAEKGEQWTRAFRKGYKETSQGLKDIYTGLTDMAKPWLDAQQASMEYARAVGMSHKTQKALLTSTASWAVKNNIGILFNKTSAELIQMQNKYSEIVGRNVQLTSEQKKDMLAMEKFLGEDGMMDIANNLENFGLGMSDSADFIHKTMNEATKSGIAASKLTKTIRENIKMAQNYTFKNGLEGLTNMAKKAIELKTDMSLVNGFLEKTSTVEGAITTGAHLQVLGGNYAMGSDPLSMMYESLNDVEGLFNRATDMAKGKVFYNSQTGNFEMGAMDRYMMKQAATVMGIDPSKLIDVAFRQASLGKIEGQARTNEAIANDEDLMSMVKNLATWDNGRAVINIDGKAKDVKDITANDKRKLEAMQRTDSENLQDMAINLRSLTEIISGTEKDIQNKRTDTLDGIAGSLHEMLVENTKMLSFLSSIGNWIGILGNLVTISSGVWATAAGVWRMGLGVRNIATGLRGGSGPLGGGAVTGGKGVVTAPKAGIVGNGFTRADFKGGFRQPTITSANGTVYRNLGGGRLQNINGGRVFGGAAAQGIIRTGTAGTSLTRLGTAALKGVKVGGAFAALGAGVSLAMDASSGELQRNTGDAVARAAIPAIASIVGGVIGGPIGAMIGGALASAATSAVQSVQKENREKLRNNIANELNETNSDAAALFNGENALQGNYNKRQLKMLKEALADNIIEEGELNDWTLKKARANDDLWRMRQQGIDVRVAMASGGYLEGPRHSEGGMPIVGSDISVEGGEFVMNRESTRVLRPYLERMNDGDFSMIARQPLGEQMRVHKSNSDGNSMPHNSKVSMEPVSINLSGTIKLDAGNKQIDISNELLNNPTLITKLTEMISKQLNILEYNSYNKGNFRQKFA